MKSNLKIKKNLVSPKPELTAESEILNAVTDK